jgi:surface antigen
MPSTITSLAAQQRINDQLREAQRARRAREPRDPRRTRKGEPKMGLMWCRPIHPRAAGWLAACAVMFSALAGSTTAAASTHALRVAFTVPVSAQVGSPVVIKGRVRGHRGSAKAALQQKVRSRFMTTSRASIRRTGRFTIRWVPLRGQGALRVRVALVRGRHVVKASRTKTLTLREPPTGTTPLAASPEQQFAGTLIDEEALSAGEGYGAGEPYAWGNCTRYAWRKRQDLPGNLGNAATWDERAAAQGFPVDTTPLAGDVAVAEAYRNGANTQYGHVFYVEGVNADGSLLVSEMNWVGLNIVSTRTVPAAKIAGLHFIHHKGQTTSAPAPTPAPPQPPAPAIYPHHVIGTCSEGACGLKKRAGPGYSNFAAIAIVYDGNQIDIVCQTTGETVYGRNAASAIWDRLSDSSYVSDYYTDTPNVGTWSPPIPRC